MTAFYFEKHCASAAGASIANFQQKIMRVFQNEMLALCQLYIMGMIGLEEEKFIIRSGRVSKVISLNFLYKQK